MDKVAYYEKLIMGDILEKEASKRLDREWKNLSNESKNKIREMKIFDKKSFNENILGKPRNKQGTIPTVGLLDRKRSLTNLSNANAAMSATYNNTSINSQYNTDSKEYKKDIMGAARSAGYGRFRSYLFANSMKDSPAFTIPAKSPKKPNAIVVARDATRDIDDCLGKSFLKNGDSGSLLSKIKAKLHENFEGGSMRRFSKDKGYPSDTMMLRNPGNPWDRDFPVNINDKFWEKRFIKAFSPIQAANVSSHRDISVPMKESALIAQLPEDDPTRLRYMSMRKKTGERYQYKKKYGFEYGKDAVYNPSEAARIRKMIIEEKKKEGYVPVKNRFEAAKVVLDRQMERAKMRKKDEKAGVKKGILI